MNCRFVESRLSSYIDGELTGREMLLVREHVSQCSCCAEELEGFRATKQMLGALAAPRCVEGFEDRLLSVAVSAGSVKVSWRERFAAYFRQNALNYAVAAAGTYAVFMILVTPQRGDFFTKGGMTDTSSVFGSGGADPDYRRLMEDHNRHMNDNMPDQFPGFYQDIAPVRLDLSR